MNSLRKSLLLIPQVNRSIDALRSNKHCSRGGAYLEAGSQEVEEAEGGGCPGIFDISDRFEKLYLSEVFQLLRIEAETERSILDCELAC